MGRRLQPREGDEARLAREREQLEQGLEKSRTGFGARLRGAFGRGEEADWDEVEETLIAGDVGAALAMDVVERARKRRDLDAEAAVQAELAALLSPRDAAHWEPAGRQGGPAIVLVVGVNGTGKTTTIGKLAARERAHGQRVVLAAADTFRAAAIDQLQMWAQRTGPRSSPTRPTPTRPPWCSTPSMPPSRAARTSSSPTPPAGCTPRRT